MMFFVNSHHDDKKKAKKKKFPNDDTSRITILGISNGFPNDDSVQKKRRLILKWPSANYDGLRKGNH